MLAETNRDGSQWNERVINEEIVLPLSFSPLLKKI